MATPRRVGLSNTRYRGPSLHNIDRCATMRSRRPNGTRTSPKDEPQVKTVESRFGVPLTDEQINAAPIGSDDEDDGPVQCGSDDSDAEGSQPADIRPSFLLKGEPVSSRAKQHILKTNSKSEAGPSPASRLRRKGNGAADSPAKKAKVEIHRTFVQDSGPLFGGTQIPKRVKSTYASRLKKSGITGSQSNGESSPEAAFKKRDISILNSPMSPEKRFKNTQLDANLARTPEPQVPKFKIFDVAGVNPTPSPEIPKFNSNIYLNDLVDSQYDVSLPNLVDSVESTKRSALKMADISTEPIPKPSEDGEETQSQAPVFRIPLALQDEIANACFELSDDLQLPATDNEVVDIQEGLIDTGSPSAFPRQAKCPMCGAAVEAKFLKNYSDGKRMNIRTQARFCRAHKKRSAQEEWVTKGYPTIDWTTLDARIARHHVFLQSLLDGASSYSRDVLEEEIKSGKDRTLAQAIMKSDVTLTPGYYGTRGLRAMSENIMYEFSPQLRKIAVADRLVSARGVTGYVQMVLVPELSVRLIAEDMNVGIDEARQIMKESVGFGDLLNEEIEDIVVLQEGDGYDN